MRKLVIAATLFASLSSEAFAQQNCAPINSVEQQLMSRFGESVRTTALANNGALVVQFANEETGTWTMLVVSADGVACALASGVAWRSQKATPKGELN